MTVGFGGKTALWGALLLTALLGSCDQEAEPGPHPPRCEPAAELQVERGLKRGYRALASDDVAAAKKAFEGVLSLDEEHPQAREGLRLLRTRTVTRDKAKAAPAGKGKGNKGHVLIGGKLHPVPLTVNTQRMRFEEERERRLVRKRMGQKVPVISRWFEQRTLTPGGQKTLSPTDVKGLKGMVDLVVLHDSHSIDSRSGFLTLVKAGSSTHFAIDYDGTVYQTLDLIHAADHTHEIELDRRSISIDLANPVEPDSAPLPEGISDPKRPLGKAMRIQGTEVMHWGYTPAQMSSLVRLCKALVQMFPKLSPDVPKVGEATPRGRLQPSAVAALRGIAGHLHIFGRAFDPGSGFDWEGFARRLARPLSGLPSASP